MIVIDHSHLGRQYRQGYLSAREYADEVCALVGQEHPFMADADPAKVLAAVAGLPAEVAAARNIADPMELATQIIGVAGVPEACFEIRDDLVLRIWPQLDAGPTERWAGGLEGRGGRVVTHFAGPWVAMHFGTLIVIALDNADRMAAYEASQKERIAP